MQAELTKLADEIYANLTPWQKTLVARHPQRPYTLDFIGYLFDEWTEIHGDRKFSDDPAIVAGFARFRGTACAIIGHQKGRNTKEKIYRNFGQPRPEGFRKALRVMKLAEKFNLPIFTFIDTQGAYPGLGAEERGQAEAIAVNLREMADAERAGDRDRDRRRRQRRRAGARRRRPRLHARARGLFGHFPRGMRGHPLEKPVGGGRSGGGDAHHRVRPEAPGDHRRHRPRAQRRRPRRSRQSRRAPRAVSREIAERAA